MTLICRIVVSKLAKKQIIRLPRHIIESLEAWVYDVETRGLIEVRKTPGYHDEPLKGHRKGQRSVRLSRAYRAIYVIKSDASIKFVLIEEVSKHGY